MSYTSVTMKFNATAALYAKKQAGILFFVPL